MDLSPWAAAIAAVALAITGFTRYLIVRAALKDTAPRDRPEILHSLAMMFRTEWRLGPVRRARPGGSDEVAPTDSS